MNKIPSTLSEMDRDIIAIQDALNPDSKSYRYDLVQIDILTLKRDIVALQEATACLEAASASIRGQLQAQEIRISILEIILTQLCKPGAQHTLSMQVSNDVLKKWEENLGKRLQ